MLSRVVLLAGAALALTAGTASAATYKVNTTADGFIEDGKCGLREAVEAARENKKEDGCPKGDSKRDTIVLREDKTYNLTVPTTNEGNNVNGDLDVTGGGPVTVRGAGKNKTTILNQGDDRIFDLESLSSSLRVERVRLSSGDVTPYGGAEGFGGSVRSFGGNLRVTSSLISGADADGGGAIFSTGRLVIDRSTFSSNGAGVIGGTLDVSGKTTIKRSAINSSDAAGANNVFGGAIRSNSSAGTTITDSSIRGSSADASGVFDAFGGGVYVDGGSLRLRSSEISGNGVSAAMVGADESGAGLYVGSGATASIVNSTFFSNIAGSPDGVGGSIYNVGTLTILHTTLDAGLAPAFADHVYTAGTTSIGHSIISGDDGTDPCAGATVTSLGFNIGEFDDPTCGYGGDDDATAFIGFAGNLADNGGPTQTVALAPSSDAVDFVPKGTCKTLTKSRDQRGLVRPNVVGGVKQKCDAGAFELGAKKP